tara:strand:+ start:60520 stop:60801 length:282 start_codon:yes stop_codon:yes gene_type:complete
MKVVDNDWELVQLHELFHQRDAMIERAKIRGCYRDGRGNGHLVSDYLETIGCYYGIRENCADPNGEYDDGEHAYLPECEYQGRWEFCAKCNVV